MTMASHSASSVPRLVEEIAAHVREANELAARSTRGDPVSREERAALQRRKVDLLRKINEHTPSEPAQASLAQAELNLDGILRTGRAYTPWPILRAPGVEDVRGRSL